MTCNFVTPRHDKHTIHDPEKKFKNKNLYDDMACYSISYYLGSSYIHVIIFKLEII
jgi:hypothetical protein